MSGVAWSVRHRRSGRPRARGWPLLVALLLVALVGCQAAPQASPSGTSGASPLGTTPATATDTVDPTPPPPAGEDPVARAVAWLLELAPGAPSGPDEVTAYLSLQEHTQQSCREVLDSELPEATEPLYHGAAAACLAALHGRSDRWAEAEAAYDALGGRPEGCLDRATYDLLESVVRAHREDPAARFRVARSSTVGLPCPTIDRLTIKRDASGALDISIRGDRLGLVRDVGLRFLSECTDDVPELGDFQSATSFDSARRSLRASVAADAVPEDATLVWVGLVAAPQPWIADHDCVEIRGGGDPPPPDDASPSAGAPNDASPSAEP